MGGLSGVGRMRETSGYGRLCRADGPARIDDLGDIGGGARFHGAAPGGSRGRERAVVPHVTAPGGLRPGRAQPYRATKLASIRPGSVTTAGVTETMSSSISAGGK